ncbi:MAG TPA: hypothetical protein VEI83_15345 [Acidimicrobiales bacterium]|nr:hypothetical protein [Acidimicrobiales bacterium]
MTARCPVPHCARPIRSWRLWRREPAERAAELDAYFPVLARFAAFPPAAGWDATDLAAFAAWGQWARTLLHDWAHGRREARSTLVTEAALGAWCTKAHRVWEALAEVDPVWCRAYAREAGHVPLALPVTLSGATQHDAYPLAV